MRSRCNTTRQHGSTANGRTASSVQARVVLLANKVYACHTGCTPFPLTPFPLKAPGMAHLQLRGFWRFQRQGGRERFLRTPARRSQRNAEQC
jgi:hypothetical protein